MIHIPDAFQQKMRTIYGADGEEWLAELPQRVAHFAEAWQFAFQEPVANLSYNYVAKVTLADGTPAIFKIGYPNREIFTEIDTLDLYQGNGMVRLLAADRTQAAFLLEHVWPGTELSELADDAEATRVLAQVMQSLSRRPPAEHTFPHIKDWAQALTRYRVAFATQTGPIPMSLIERAQGYFGAFLTSPADDVLLHGDLHHFNVLSAGNGRWVAIDPKGVVGHAVYECGRFLHNPHPDFLLQTGVSKIIDRRVGIICDLLGVDRQLVLMAGFCDAVIGSVWSVEDGEVGHLEPILRFVECVGGEVRGME